MPDRQRTRLAGPGESGALARLLDAIDGVRAAEGWLHLEVVGRRLVDSPRAAEAVAAYLRDREALHVAHGEVWDVDGGDAWRVTALIRGRTLTESPRALFRLGALRVVGLPIRFAFERNGASTFDSLAEQQP